MLLEALEIDVLTALEGLVDDLDIAIDADELARVFRLRDRFMAKSMAPLRAFDESQLYQLSKASSTKEFLERTPGLAPAEAGFSVGLARKLGAMPETEARWAAGTLLPGHVRAVMANVTKRIVDQFQEFEGELLDCLTPLTVSEAATAMNKWAIDAHALADDVKGKSPREDEFYHSNTLGGRYVSNGTSGPETGAVIAKALELAEADNPRDNDTRSPPSAAEKHSRTWRGSMSTTAPVPTPIPTRRSCRRSETGRNSSPSPPHPNCAIVAARS